MKRKHRHSSMVGARLLNVMLAVVIAFGLVPASAFAVATQGSNFAQEQESSAPIESYVIAKTDDAAEIEDEPVVSCLGDTYLLSYPSVQDAADAAARLSEVCEFAEVDRPMIAAENSADEAATAKGYDEGADPFSITAEALDGFDESNLEEDSDSKTQDAFAGKITETVEETTDPGEKEAGQSSNESEFALEGTEPGNQGEPSAAKNSEGTAPRSDEDGLNGEAPSEDAIGQDEAHEKDRNVGNDVLIALVDSGAPDSKNVIDSISVLGGESKDENGHATKVLAAILGQAPDARVLAVRVLDAQAVGTVAATYAGIMAAVAQGASIVNLSLYAALDDESAAINSAVQEARDAGCVVVAAAGNAGQDAAGYVPANADEAVTAGSCDAKGVRLDVSNYGDDVNVYVVSDATSIAAGTVSGWLAVHSDLSNPPADLAHACGNGLFFSSVQDPAGNINGEEGNGSDSADNQQNADGVGENVEVGSENGEQADYADKVTGAMSVSTTAAELRNFRPRDDSVVPRNEVVFDDNGKLPLTEATIGALGSESKPSGLTKKSLTLVTDSGDTKDCYGVWISMPSVSDSSTKSIDGSFTLKWTNVAMDADGNRLDLVLDVSNIKVRTNDARAKKSKHLTLFRNSNAAGTGYLWMYSWMQALSDGSSGGRVGLTMRIKAHLYKTGTTTATSSKYLLRFTDIDQPDKSLQAASQNDYSGAFTESVQLRSGFESRAFIQKSFPKTEYKEENPTYGASLLDVDTSTAKFTATQRDGYGTYYRAGFLGQTSGGTFAIQWWGSICGTALFTDYEGVAIRDKNDATTSGVTDRAIITKSVNAYGQKSSNQDADYNADTNHGGKRTKTTFRKTNMPWKGSATYNFSAKPGYRVSKVTLTYTSAPSSTSSALQQTTKTYTSGNYLSRIAFNNSSSEYAAVRDYDIVVTTAKVPDATATIQATKSVEGGTLADREFTLGLYDSNKKLIESKTTTRSSSTSQAISFSPLSYVYDDTVYTSSRDYSKTYAYYVKESIPSVTRPYTYDEAWHPISVTVTYNASNYTMSARVSSGNNPSIVNSCQKAGGVALKKVDAGNINKTLAGAEFSVYEGTYESMEATAALTPVVVMVSGADGIARTGDATLNADGASYTVVETKAPSGYYPNTSWYRNFTLSEDGQVVDFTTNQADWCVDEAKPATVGLVVSKELEGGHIQEGAYAFDIESIGANRDDAQLITPPMPASTTAYTDADGVAAFDEMTFTGAGTYYYLISEEEGNDCQTTYDPDVWLATVRVIKSSGELIVSNVKYEKGALCVLRTYDFIDVPDNYWVEHCIVGVGTNRDAAWKDAAQSWLTLTDGSCSHSLDAAPDDCGTNYFWDLFDNPASSSIVYYNAGLQANVKTSQSAATFRNVYEGRCGVCAKKLDSQTQGPLAGAVFEVIGEGANARIYDEDGQTEMESLFITTGDDGVARSHDKALVIGESYRIREVRSPDGYALDDAQWHEFDASKAESVESGIVCQLCVEGFMRCDNVYEDLALTGEGTTQSEAWSAVVEALSAYPYQGSIDAPYNHSVPENGEHVSLFDHWDDFYEGMVTYESAVKKTELLEDGDVVDVGTWEDSPLRLKVVLRAHKQFYTQTGRSMREPRAISAGQFSFELIDEQGNVLETVSSDSSDTGEVDVTFSPIWYDFDDAGQTFNYIIREKQGEEQGVSYDSLSRRVAVNVYVQDAESRGVAGTSLEADIAYPDGSCEASDGGLAAGPFVNVLNPTFDVRVFKESQDDLRGPHEPLAGAEYTVFEWNPGLSDDSEVDVPDLFKSEDDFATSFVFNKANQSLSFDEVSLSDQWGLHVSAVIATGPDGYASTMDGCLESGKSYVIVETKAPEGYTLNDARQNGLSNTRIYVIDDYADDGSFSHMVYRDGDSQVVRHLNAEGALVSQDFDEAFTGYAYVIGSAQTSIFWDDSGFIFANSPVGTPRGGVLVQKVDAVDSTVPLAGAWFDVYDEDEFSQRYAAWKVSNPSADDADFLVSLAEGSYPNAEQGSISVLEPVCSLGPTDEHGWATTSASALDVGKVYRIVESVAPVGYDLPAYDFLAPNDIAAGNATVQIPEEGSIQTVATNGASLQFSDKKHQKRGGVRVKKVDSGDSHPLEGAVFAVEAGDTRFTMTTNAEGIAELDGNTLPEGSYTVTEITPPEGYVLNTGWRADFDIVDEGVVVDLTDFPCEDEPEGVALPSTGSTGITVVSFAALAAVLEGLRRLAKPTQC